jgi:hypothetical protein
MDKAVEDSSGSSTRDWPQWERSFLNMFSTERKNKNQDLIEIFQARSGWKFLCGD